MNYLPLTLYWMLLFKTVVASLPTPVNVHVISSNFLHELRWEPGPGTPPGTSYIVTKRQQDGSCENTWMVKTTSINLRMQPYDTFVLTVRASYNGTKSLPGKVTFTPFEATILGPPQVTLTGCGNYIEINITLPIDVMKVLRPEFQITWKKHGGNAMGPILTRNKTVTLDNLAPGTEYCIQVTLDVLHKKNVKPSNWSCIVLSALESRGVVAVAGAVSAGLVIVISAVIILVFLLYYTGCICKLKAALPKVMTMALIQNYILTPERTVFDRIFINSETERRKNRPAIPQPATGGAHSDNEDEEQEEDEFQLYVNRAVELSSGIDSCKVSGSSKLVASVDSGNMSDRISAEVEVEEEFDNQGQGAEDSLLPGRSTTGDTTELEEVETEEVCENSGSVNLFSVTLGALDVHKEEVEEEEEEEEEEEGTRDFLKLELECLLPRNSQHTQGHIDSQTEIQSDSMEAVDSCETGYEGKWTNTHMYGLQNSLTQSEEEDEDFSGYLSHR